MQGRDLKYLAAVADLARLDFEAASLTLTGEAGTVTALYQGAYSGGWRRIQDDDTPNFQVSVSATKIRAIAALFRDDEPVKVTLVENAVRLKGGSSTATMQEWGEVRPYDIVSDGIDDLAISFRMPAVKALEEFETSEAFVAENNLKPILTGINIEARGKRVSITTFDGFGLLYKSESEANVFERGTMVVPSADFLIGLKLVSGAQSDDVLFKRPKHNDVVIMHNKAKTAMFRIPLLVGTWPAIDSIVNAPVVGNPITFTSEQLRTLVASGKIYDSNEVILEPTNSRVNVIVSGDEGGRFVMTLKGTLSTRVIYALDAFDKLSKIGTNLVLTVPTTADFPTTAETGTRRAWLVSRG